MRLRRPRYLAVLAGAGWLLWKSGLAQISQLERNTSNATLDILHKVFGAMQTVVKIQLVPQAQ